MINIKSIDPIVKGAKIGMSDYIYPTSKGMFFGHFITDFVSFDKALAIDPAKVNESTDKPQLKKLMERISKSCRSLIQIPLMGQCSTIISYTVKAKGFSGLPGLASWGLTLIPVAIRILSDKYRIFQIAHDHIGDLSKVVTVISGIALIVFGQTLVGGGMVLMIGLQEVTDRKILPEKISFVVSKGLVLFGNINSVVSGGYILKFFGMIGIISNVARVIFPSKPVVAAPIHKLTAEQLQKILDGKILVRDLKINHAVDLRAKSGSAFKDEFFAFLYKEKETLLLEACAMYVSVAELAPWFARPLARIWLDFNAILYKNLFIKFPEKEKINEASNYVFSQSMWKFTPKNLQEKSINVPECFSKQADWWKDWVTSNKEISDEQKEIYLKSINDSNELLGHDVIFEERFFAAMLVDMGVMEPVFF